MWHKLTIIFGACLIVLLCSVAILHGQWFPYYYDSTAGGGPASGSGLLLEGGTDSFLLLESGDYLLLE